MDEDPENQRRLIETSAGLAPASSGRKRLFIILGVSAFVAMLLLMGVVLMVFRTVAVGKTLDAESKKLVDEAVPAIIANWDKQELLHRASPEFERVTSPEDLDKVFGMMNRLGKFQSYDGCQGGSKISITNRRKEITAVYVAKATFEAVPAVIRLSLIKQDGHWRIASFHVDSEVFRGVR